MHTIETESLASCCEDQSKRLWPANKKFNNSVDRPIIIIIIIIKGTAQLFIQILATMYV